MALIGATKLLKDARITTSVVIDDTDADSSALEDIEKEISEYTKSLPAVDECKCPNIHRNFLFNINIMMKYI